MDMSKVGRGHLVAAIGGAVLIIALFLHWEDVTGESAWDAFSGMDIIMLIVGVLALVYGLAPGFGVDPLPSADSRGVVFVLGVLAAGWALGWDLEISTAGLGAWLGLFAAIAIALGAKEPAWITGSPAGRRTGATPPPPPPPPPPEPPSSPPPGPAQ